MLRVLPNQGNLNRREVLRDINRLLPQLPQGFALGNPLGRHREFVKVEALCEELQQALLVEEKGNLVHGLHVMDADHLLEVDLTV